MILKQTPLSLRSLKGAPLSTLMALHLASGPLPHKDIMAWTGYSDKTITRALDILDSMGLAVQDSLSWYLTQQGTILFRRLAGLGMGVDACANSVTTANEEPDTMDHPNHPDHPNTAEAPTHQENADQADQHEAAHNPEPEGHKASPPPDRKISGPLSSSSKTSLTPMEGKRRRRQETPAPGKIPPTADPPQTAVSPDTTDSSPNTAVSRQATPKPPTYRLLRQAGVGISMSNHLSQLKWVTPNYVRAHLDKIKQDDEPLNYAIQRMREGDPAPVCHCNRCPECRERTLVRMGIADVVVR